MKEKILPIIIILGLCLALLCCQNFEHAEQIFGVSDSSTTIIGFGVGNFSNIMLVEQLNERNESRGWDSTVSSINLNVGNITYLAALENETKQGNITGELEYKDQVTEPSSPENIEAEAKPTYNIPMLAAMMLLLVTYVSGMGIAIHANSNLNIQKSKRLKFNPQI